MSYPHIENSSDYREFIRDFEHVTKGLEALSSGPCPGCSECGLENMDTMDCEEYELAGESYYSSSPCDICSRRLGGDRESAHFLMDGEIVHLDICVDCAYFMEYGQLDDMTMLKVE